MSRSDIPHLWMYGVIIVTLIGAGMAFQRQVSALQESDREQTVSLTSEAAERNARITALQNIVNDLARRVCLLETRGQAVDTRCPAYAIPSGP